MGKIEVTNADIITMEVDAIVNSATLSLLGGAGLDGMIHRAAGPKLLEECRKLGGCQVGHAQITNGYNLQAKHVIHTVGPIWQDGYHREPDLLKACYINTLELAVKNNCKTIVFPMISVGVQKYPLDKATILAFSVVSEFLKKNKSIEKVYFFCNSNESCHLLRKQLEVTLI